jgi:hypothetical protein
VTVAEQARIQALEQSVATLSRTLHITVGRMEWALARLAEASSEDELDALWRIEVECIFDCAEHGSPRDAAAARQHLDRLGLTVPSYIPTFND